MLSETRTGPIVSSDGAVNPLRSDRTGAGVVTDAHARYQEAVLRGNVYTVSTAAAGITTAAGNVSPLGAAGTPIVGIFNPQNSGKNAVILTATIGLIPTATTTVPFGAAVWNVAPAPQSITQAGTVPTNNFTFKLAGSSMIGLVNQAATGSTAYIMLRPIFCSYQFALAAGDNFQVMVREEVAGEIICPPGASVGIAVTAAGTTPVTVASMTWEEVNV